MVASAKAREPESVEKEPLLPIRDLLPICIDNSTYDRGLFNENCFSDNLAPEIGMKIKKLMPMDVKSRSLIDWMENGVYDALQKKYLKTLLLRIYEEEEGPKIEEYAFSFSYPNTSTEEVAMNMSRTGSKKGSTSSTSNASEVTPEQIRSSASKMIRTLISLMRTLDPMPEERTILMKLLYYDAATPEDYEPLFFKFCADNEAINIWNKNPLKLEMGNVNSKQLASDFKVKSVLDRLDDNNVSSGDDGMNADNESDHDDDFSDTEVCPSEADRYVIDTADDTQDSAHEEELTAQGKEYICSRDVLSNFPCISMEMVEDITERLLKYDVAPRATKDECTVNQTADLETPHIKELCQYKVQKCIHKMVKEQDIYVKNSDNKRFGKSVMYSEATERKLLEIENILACNEGGQRVIDTNAKDDHFESKDMEGAVGCILCTNPTVKVMGT